MKKYHVAAGDGKGYYGVNYESYREATELLKISQRHDPKAHIVEEEYHLIGLPNRNLCQTNTTAL